jgi:quinoprotein glucose dehydrogenase
MGTVMEMPGNNGGANWGTTAADPTSGTYFVLSKEAPSLLQLAPKRPRPQMSGTPETQGRVLYIQNCQTCHLESLAGQPPGIPSLVGVMDRRAPDMVRTLVQNGMAPMPAFPDLSATDINNLIAYLAHPENAHIPPDILARLMNPPPPSPRLAPAGTRYWTGYGYMNSSEGLPAISPPWSTLTAYDLNSGAIKWHIPFGGVSSLEEKGITDTGSFWPRGGIAITAGGLIFGGSISDNTMRAYDEDTGKVLWQTKLPAGPEGIPAVFEVAGKEYMVISARPSTRTPTAAGGATPQEMAEAPAVAPGAAASSAASQANSQGYYVFALPDTH